MHKLPNPEESTAQAEARLRKQWQEQGTMEQSIARRAGFPRFVFFEGPPTANGKPGIHHVLSRTIKDTVCRYKTMQGFQVHRKAGWDTHGLPVEIEVEKILGLEDKKGIEAYGVDKFNEQCRKSVFTYEKQWRELTGVMGYWIDLDNPYITLDNNYIESVWWLLNQMRLKDLIYNGYRIVPYCPSCGTPLSSHEVAQGYEEVEDPSVFVLFAAKGEADTYYLAWTTTPWTLISNVALAVNAEAEYVKVRHQDKNIILAKALLRVLDGEYEILETFTGKDLEYREYEQLFKFVGSDKKAWYIVTADYVSMEDGTGIVHTAPAFGQDDYATGQRYGLPVIQPVNGEGRFTAEVTPWAGQFVKDADKDIIRTLKERGVLYKRAQIKHTYPFCWRCQSPLIYYARDSWYIATTRYRDQLQNNNAGVDWHPPFVGEKRFGDWLSNNVDWSLSRDRFWGTPLPVWVCPDCGKMDGAGSRAELQQKGKLKNGNPVPADLDLHKPYIDDVVFTCPDCGGTMTRTPEVIDCWFDSGAMPFAQWHYPFENKEAVDNGTLFPADFISEGIDQTRGWFYSLLAISTIIKGVAPYKTVLVNDLILDKNGQKMSKSRGNSVDPMDPIGKYGADAVRWYMLAVSSPWLPTRFNPAGVEEVVAKYFGTLKNTYSFYATYANIDGFDATEHLDGYTAKAELDRWIISRLHEVIALVCNYNNDYDFTRSLRLLTNFVVEEVSNWYVRRSRRRFWSMELTPDKIQAYCTLHTVLTTVARLMAPVAPYYSDELYMNLTGDESVHLQDYPVSRPELIDETLNRDMEAVMNIVTMGRAARNNCRIKVRQPLPAVYLPASLEHLATKPGLLGAILEELNVKNCNFWQDSENQVKFEVKLNYKTAGPKFGKAVKDISAALAQVSVVDLIGAIEASEGYTLTAAGARYELTRDDIIFAIIPPEGYSCEARGSFYVALDTAISPALEAEGLARELVNRIQNTRKDSGFEIMDRICLEWSGSDEIAAVWQDFGSFIMDETLMNNCKRVDWVAGMPQWDINGREVYYRLIKEPSKE